MKISEVRDRLANAGIYPDGLSKSKGVFTFRRGYFYTHGQTADGWRDTIQKALPDAKIVDHGNHWAPFRGGAPLSRQSHFYVKFIME